MPIARLAHLLNIWNARVNDAKGDGRGRTSSRGMSSAPGAAASVPSWSTPALGMMLAFVFALPISVLPLPVDLKTTVWWFVAVPLAFAAVSVPFMLRDGEHAGQTLGKQLFGLRVIDDSHGASPAAARPRANCS